MSPQSIVDTVDGKDEPFSLPRDTSSVIEWLDEAYPVKSPTAAELAGGEATMRFAMHAGKRELIDHLKFLNESRRGT
jgi:hypothetical protein